MDVGEEGLAIARADRIFAVSVDTGRQADRERDRGRPLNWPLSRARPMRQTEEEEEEDKADPADDFGSADRIKLF